MEKNITDREWNELAARLSGEESTVMAAETAMADDTPFLRKAWNDIGINSMPMEIDVDKAWSKVADRIATEEHKELEDSQNSIPKRRFFIRHATRIAAAILLLVASVWLTITLQQPRVTNVVASMAERSTEVVLDDGSKVTLFRGSELTYPNKFNGDTREVALTGEAFFEVTPNKDKPFIVKAGLAEIKVLGTSFNVLAGLGESNVEVFVESGQVQVTNTVTSEVIILEKGVVGQLSESFTRSGENINANILSWSTGVLRYDGTELSTVFEDLRKLYDIEIDVDSEEILKYELTTGFENYEEETVIKIICAAFKLDYIRAGKTYTLSME